MQSDRKARLIFFIRRRLQEFLGLFMIALGCMSFYIFFQPSIFDVVVEPLRIWLGGMVWGLNIILLSWGWAVLRHREEVWRLWRFLLLGFALVCLSLLFEVLDFPFRSKLGGLLFSFLESFPELKILLDEFAPLALAVILFVFISALPFQWGKFFGWNDRRKRNKISKAETRTNNLSPLIRNLKGIEPQPVFRESSEHRPARFSKLSKFSLSDFIRFLSLRLRAFYNSVFDFIVRFWQKLWSRQSIRQESVIVSRPTTARRMESELQPELKKPPLDIELRPELPLSARPSVFKARPSNKAASKSLPLKLLETPLKMRRPLAQHESRALADRLEAVLKDFNIQGEIIAISAGPVVTLFEFLPAPGVKSSRIIGLADDIARSMSAFSARIANIRGQNVIGIEIPNIEREDVHLGHLLSDGTYKQTVFDLPLALGTTISGETVICDLAAMPHLLVAGTTGSGKSVAINGMILSLLYHLRSDACKLIMIDPKMLELSVYQDIPHLLTPVVTEPKKAVAALKWIVSEMEDRYRRMSSLNVRNIGNYNKKQSASEQLPFIVVIIDEMADLMMVAGKEIEAAIQRLAQMARAAGIHLIAATQRPSVDVITGTIKANFPTRISFQVASRIDSRTILGEGGAEQLLGRGDMLLMKAGGKIERVHGPFVSDMQVEKIAAFLREHGPAPDYHEEVVKLSEEKPVSLSLGEGGGDDDLYEQAMQIVREFERASTSFLQRKLQIGYNRAARLIERMEEEGYISAPSHSGKRQILKDEKH